jgi:hypothetical protein
MKSLLIALSFLMTFSVFASTGSSGSVTIDGSRNQSQVDLNGTKTHTEYRSVFQHRTCYRRVRVGYGRICHRERTGERCRTNNQGRRICTPTYRNVCRDRARHRQVPYDCSFYRQVPYEVFDYNVVANTNFTFGDFPAGIRANETLKVKLHGDLLTVKTKSSGNLILLYNKTVSQYMNGDTKYIQTDYFLEFMDLRKATSAFNKPVQLTELVDGKLIFKLGELNEEMNYIHTLKIVRKKFLARNPVLIDRILLDGETEIEHANGATTISIDSDNHCVDLKKGRFNVEFKTKLNVPADRVLNIKDIPNLFTKSKNKLKIKRNGKIKIK